MVRLFLALTLAVSAAAEHRVVARVRMRDGVRLSTNVYLPDGPRRFSSLLLRTPYGKGDKLITGYRPLLDHGYAVIVQDVRGRYESEGRFQPLTQELPDGDDTLNWIASQP